MTHESSIKPSQVRVGVFVRIPLPWMQHSFLASSFLVTNERQVQEIQALGVDLQFDAAKSKVAPLPAPAEPPAPDPAREAALAQLRAQQEAQVAEKRARADAMARMRGRLDAVQKSFSSAAEQTAASFTQLGARPKECVNAIRDVAEESALALLGDPDSTILMVVDKGAQGGYIGHSMSVMTLSLLVAKHLALPEPMVRLIGMGALLHDIGLRHLNPSLVRNPARNRHEEAAFQAHCQLGFDELKALGPIVPAEVLITILRHHEREDGKGYPGGKSGAEIPLYVKIISIAERFDELTNPVDYAHALSPFEALSVLWARDRTGYDGELLQHFIRAMGVYPPGTLVQLSDGRIGVVVAAAPPNARLAPQVLIYDAGTPRREGIIIDLADPGMPAGTKIERALRAQGRPDDELDYLLPRRKISWFRANP